MITYTIDSNGIERCEREVKQSTVYEFVLFILEISPKQSYVAYELRFHQLWLIMGRGLTWDSPLCSAAKMIVVQCGRSLVTYFETGSRMSHRAGPGSCL